MCRQPVDGGGKGVVSRGVYERAFFGSSTSKDFVLKMLSAIFSNAELARSNINGGPVFNGTRGFMWN